MTPFSPGGSSAERSTWSPRLKRSRYPASSSPSGSKRASSIKGRYTAPRRTALTPETECRVDAEEVDPRVPRARRVHPRVQHRTHGQETLCLHGLRKRQEQSAVGQGSQDGQGRHLQQRTRRSLLRRAAPKPLKRLVTPAQAVSGRLTELAARRNSR